MRFVFGPTSGPCEAVAKAVQGEKVTTAGALECVKTLKGRVLTLRNEKAVKEVVIKTKASERNTTFSVLPSA